MEVEGVAFKVYTIMAKAKANAPEAKVIKLFLRETVFYSMAGLLLWYYIPGDRPNGRHRMDSSLLADMGNRSCHGKVMGLL